MLNHVTVKGSPAEELIAGTHALSSALETEFATQVRALASGDPTMARNDRFNEFESVSQDTKVQYATFASARIRSRTQRELSQIFLPDRLRRLECFISLRELTPRNAASTPDTGAPVN